MTPSRAARLRLHLYFGLIIAEKRVAKVLEIGPSRFVPTILWEHGARDTGSN